MDGPYSQLIKERYDRTHGIPFKFHKNNTTGYTPTVSMSDINLAVAKNRVKSSRYLPSSVGAALYLDADKTGDGGAIISRLASRFPVTDAIGTTGTGFKSNPYAKNADTPKDDIIAGGDMELDGIDFADLFNYSPPAKRSRLDGDKYFNDVVISSQVPRNIQQLYKSGILTTEEVPRVAALPNPIPATPLTPQELPIGNTNPYGRQQNLVRFNGPGTMRADEASLVTTYSPFGLRQRQTDAEFLRTRAVENAWLERRLREEQASSPAGPVTRAMVRSGRRKLKTY